MKYTVVWQPVAEDRLAEIWAVAKDRRAVAQAANAIDKALRLRPALSANRATVLHASSSRNHW